MKNWSVSELGIKHFRSRGITGKGILVGHLDSGVDAAHPSLRGNVHAFAHFNKNGILSNDQTIRDTGHHGTHTAGIICGREINGTAIGAAPGAKLCSAAVIEGGKTVVRVLAGLEWMLDQPVRILLVALGLPGYHPILQSAINKFIEKGVLVIAPVGNAGIGHSRSPANYPKVLAVGAVDAAGSVPRFSASEKFDRGASPLKPEVLAPGTFILSTKNGGGVEVRTGTSMAAAQVTGMTALLMEAAPGAASDEVCTALKKSAKRLLPMYSDRYAYGLIDPVGAWELLIGKEGSGPTFVRPTGPCLTSDFLNSFSINRNISEKTDPRLRAHLLHKMDGALVEAVLLFSVKTENESHADWKNSVQLFVDEFHAMNGGLLRCRLFMPAFRIVIVEGEKWLISRFIQHPRVLFASATDISSAAEMW